MESKINRWSARKPDGPNAVISMRAGSSPERGGEVGELSHKVKRADELEDGFGLVLPTRGDVKAAISINSATPKMAVRREEVRNAGRVSLVRDDATSGKVFDELLGNDVEPNALPGINATPQSGGSPLDRVRRTEKVTEGQQMPLVNGRQGKDDVRVAATSVQRDTAVSYEEPNPISGIGVRGRVGESIMVEREGVVKNTRLLNPTDANGMATKTIGYKGTAGPKANSKDVS